MNLVVGYQCIAMVQALLCVACPMQVELLKALQQSEMRDELDFFFSSRRRHTTYIGDWSSDVCSSDLGLEVARALRQRRDPRAAPPPLRVQLPLREGADRQRPQIGRASCRERV